MNPTLGLLLGIAALYLLRRFRTADARPHSRRAGAPWPRRRDLLDDAAICARLPTNRWFTVTDVARALQNVPPGRKPSGSAGRDARSLIDGWVRRGIVEVGRFGPSHRRFLRFT